QVMSRFFIFLFLFFFSSRRRHTIFSRDWSSDVCSSDLDFTAPPEPGREVAPEPSTEDDDAAALRSLREDVEALIEDGRTYLETRSEEHRVGEERRLREGLNLWRNTMVNATELCCGTNKM